MNTPEIMLLSHLSRLLSPKMTPKADFEYVQAAQYAPICLICKGSFGGEGGT